MSWPDDYIECTRCGDPAWEDTRLCTKCELRIKLYGSEEEKEA